MKQFLLLLCATSNLVAQTVVTGRVVDATEPDYFPPATIYVLATETGVYTDAFGKFRVEVPTGSDVEITALGYETLRLTHAELSVPLLVELQPSAELMDEVVVSASLKPTRKLDSPVPVDVYTPRFFRKNPAPSVFESLQHVNGVRPQLNCNVCNTGDIHINGLEGPYTMVLIDGMPIVSGLSTVYGLTGIPQALIERMEVVRGPASTLYGSEAVGGLINLITKAPERAPRFTADVFGSDWGELNADLGARYALGNRTHGLLGLHHFRYQRPIDRNGDGFTDLTLQNRTSVFQKLSFPRTDGKPFTLAGRFVYEDRWGGQTHWTPTDRGGNQVYGESIRTHRWETFGTYALPGRANLTLQYSANGHHQDSFYGDVPYRADQTVAFAQLLWRYPWGAHELLSGASYRYTHYDDNTPATGSETANAPSRIHLPGLFVQDEWRWNARQKLLMGLRYDLDSRHGSILAPRLNWKWHSTNRQHVLRVGVGNGYRVANVFTEDHAALTGARRVIFAEALRPETSWNATLNYHRTLLLDAGAAVWNFDATLFYTHFTNRILPDYETNANLIIYDNLNGHSVSRGVSLGADYDASATGWHLTAGLTLMDVTVTENRATRRQLLTESVQGVWTISYAFQRLGLTIDYTGNVYGPMRLPRLGPLDDRPEFSPWWSLQNVQLTQRLGERVELYGGVKNLLNFRPPANSIARAFDPFDRGVTFDAAGNALPTPNNPNALTFDPSYAYAPNQGIRGFLGLRLTVR